MHLVDIQQNLTLDDYAAFGSLVSSVEGLRTVARSTYGGLDGRTVWMVNSTERGGGVAEMLPKMVSILRELGVQTEWVVVDSDDDRFFSLTKRIHNMLHGEGDGTLTAEDRKLYETVSREQAAFMRGMIREGDILVIHDPQPLGMGAILKEELGIPAIWRCHIGLDEQNAATRAAWSFLKPWTLRYDQAVFSIDSYAPAFLKDRLAVIPPAIDPLSSKNRELLIREVAGILAGASLSDSASRTLAPVFAAPAQRLQPDDSFELAYVPEDLDLMYRPVVAQVSRWDRLKGFAPLLKGFELLKQRRSQYGKQSDEHRRCLDLVRLVLVGPDPSSIQDDPEGLEVFEELSALWRGLDPEIRDDVAILVLPMESRTENALMVNAIQRCATVVVQNSLREGFGLTVTEAMWKRNAVLGSTAVGIQEQVRDGVDGLLCVDPEDPNVIAAALNQMLASPQDCEMWGRNAQRRVHDRYLIFSQIASWLQVLQSTVESDRVAA